MALINKIREKSGIVIGLIALSLILFIVGGDLLGSRSLMGGNSQKVGEIAGHDVMYDEFQQQVEQLKAGYQARLGRAVNDQELNGLREQAWNQLVVKYAYQPQYDALGLKVSDDEAYDMVHGNNIYPSLKQEPIFTNQKTGQFDKSLVNDFFSNLKKAPIDQQLRWKEYEDNMRADRLRTKYENLLNLSTFVTSQEAKREYQSQTEKANVKFLYIPFSSIVDSTVKVTDDQLRDYLNRNKDKYKGADTRSIEYITFSVLPSKKDSADFLQELKDLARGLATAENDSAFAKANSDVDVNADYIGLSQMSEPLRATVGTFYKGGIYGPYQEGDTYAIYKLIDSKEDSVPSSAPATS